MSFQKKSDEPFPVRGTPFQTVRLLDHTESFHQEIDLRDAKKIAEGAGLELVCFNRPTDKALAFCKVIDYGKWKYSNDKRKKKQAKEQKRTTKEIRLSPVIDDHDIDHKLKQAKEFLEDGDEVILTMKLKGRQRSHFSEAEEKMNEILGKCPEGKEVARKKTKSTITVRITQNKMEDKK